MLAINFSCRQPTATFDPSKPPTTNAHVWLLEQTQFTRSVQTRTSGTACRGQVIIPYTVDPRPRLEGEIRKVSLVSVCSSQRPYSANLLTHINLHGPVSPFLVPRGLDITRLPAEISHFPSELLSRGDLRSYPIPNLSPHYSTTPFRRLSRFLFLSFPPHIARSQGPTA